MKKGVVVACLLMVLAVSGCLAGAETQAESLPLAVLVRPETAGQVPSAAELAALLGPEDYLAGGPEVLDALASLPGVKRRLLLKTKYLPRVQALLTEARKSGLDVALNLEGPFAPAWLAQQARAVAGQAHALGLQFTFGPTLYVLQRWYPVFVPFSDAVVVQFQQGQRYADWLQRVSELVKAIKRTRPDLKVWVQLSLNPPGDYYYSLARVVAQVEQLRGLADGVALYWHPGRAEALLKVLHTLRPAGAATSASHPE